jgi:hypothetical protein
MVNNMYVDVAQKAEGAIKLTLEASHPIIIVG